MPGELKKQAFNRRNLNGNQMKTVLLLSLSLIAGVALAQDAYNFSTFTDPYTSFSDGASAVDDRPFCGLKILIQELFSFRSLPVFNMLNSTPNY